MVTGHSEHYRVVTARDAGVNELLVKPLSARALFTRIQTIIERPRPFIRTRSYFGPCRRRKKSAKYTGPERRKTEMPEIDFA
jgi:DNA-binding response OmpR family regulator